MNLSFDDLYDKTIETALWVYLVASIIFSGCLFWHFILEPNFESLKFAPGSPVGYPGGKTLPGDPKAPLQTPCKIQIEAK